MTPSLQLNLFGSPQITYQGQPLTGFVSIKVRALLIYLAVTARPHSRDHLAHLLWEDTPASMKPNLRKALSNLRQLIGDLLVEEGKELITLDPQRCWIDVVEFERLLKSADLPEAAQLYTADFLDGFNPSLSYEFEAWTLREQSRLKSGMVDLLRKLTTQQETRHTLPEAIQTVRRLLALEPWQEESHRWLMTLLARNGQRSAALAHFEVCKRVLQEELAVAPSAETLQLVAQIQQAAMPVHKPTAKLPTIAQPEFPLIGREREWQTIQAAWQHSLQNGPHFVCIAGEAGIGKTRLTEEARLWVAQQGYASAYARSYAAEGALAFSPVVDWLRSEAIRPSLGQLDAVWLNEVARLLPELLTEYPHLSPPKPISDGIQRRHFFESLARAVLVSGEPLLLVIDDLQWCDNETLEWLRFLLRFDPGYSLLVIGAYRVEEVERDHPVQMLTQLLYRDALVTEIKLVMVNKSDTTTLINIVANTKLSISQVEEVWYTTSGHPLFVIESIRSKATQNIKTQVPLKIEGIIQLRLRRLSHESYELAEIAATIGRSFTSKLLQIISNRNDEIFLKQLEELWKSRVIKEVTTSLFDFAHDRFREAINDTISPIRRKLLHYYVAHALEQFDERSENDIAAQLATHFQLAGHIEKAVMYYGNAARQLLIRGATKSALSLIEQGIKQNESLPTTETNLRQLLELYLQKHEIIVTLDGYLSLRIRSTNEQISNIANKLNDSHSLFHANNKRRIYHMLRAEWLITKELAEQNVQLAEWVENIDLHVGSLSPVGVAYFHLGNLLEARKWFERSMKDMEKLDKTIVPAHGGWRIEISVFASASHCYSLLGYPNQASQMAEEAISVANQTNHNWGLAHSIQYRLMLDLMLKAKKSFSERFSVLWQLSQDYDFRYYRESCRLFEGWLLVQKGEFDQGISQIQHTIHCRIEQEHAMYRTYWLSVLITAHLMAKQYIQGSNLCKEALAFAEKSKELFWVSELHRLQGDMFMDTNNNMFAVEECYLQALQIAREQKSKLLELRSAASLARLWQSQGKHAEAHQLLAPIYAWFTEGFDTPDLIEAKQLLDELTA